MKFFMSELIIPWLAGSLLISVSVLLLMTFDVYIPARIHRILAFIAVLPLWLFAVVVGGSILLRTVHF